MAIFCQRRRHKNTITAPNNGFAVVILSLIFITQRTTNAFSFPSTALLNYPSSRQYVSDTTAIRPRISALSMVAKSGGRMLLTTEEFEAEVLFDGGDESNNPDDGAPIILPVLVLFSAPWCGPCRLTNPVVKEVMKQYQTKIEVVEISTDDLPEVASNAGVTSIPTIQLYHKGKVMDTIVGCVAKNVLAKAVDKVLEDLGMLDEEEEGGEV